MIYLGDGTKQEAGSRGGTAQFTEGRAMTKNAKKVGAGEDWKVLKEDRRDKDRCDGRRDEVIQIGSVHWYELAN